MSDLGEKISSEIQEALSLDEDVALVTEIVVGYNFLDPEGNTGWGIHIPEGQQVSTTFYLSEVLHRRASQWVNNSIFSESD